MTFRAKTDNPSYHPGRCAEVYCGNDYIGVFGQVHPKVLENFNVSGEVYAMELEVEALYKNRGGIVEYKPLAKFPAISRDISVVCDEKITAAAVEACIRDGRSARLFWKRYGCLTFTEAHRLAQIRRVLPIRLQCVIIPAV